MDSADLIEFSAGNCVSWGIRAATFSRASHIAIACAFTRDEVSSRYPKAPALAAWDEDREPYRLFFVESTTMASAVCAFAGVHTSGVQAQLPISRITGYRGRMWQWPVSDVARNHFIHDDEEFRSELAEYLLNRMGTRYDTLQAVNSATHYLKWLPWLSKADMRSIFCSELVIGAYRACGLLSPEVIPAVYSPAGAFRKLHKAGIISSPEVLKNATP